MYVHKLFHKNETNNEPISMILFLFDGSFAVGVIYSRNSSLSNICFVKKIVLFYLLLFFSTIGSRFDSFIIYIKYNFDYIFIE